MRVCPWHAELPLAFLLLLPLLAFAQEPPLTEKQAPKDEPPKPRVDLYGDPLPEGAVARMGTVRLHASEGQRSLALSPDGKTIATAGTEDPTVSLWDTTTARLLRTFDGHEPGVRFMEFSPDGKTLATFDGDDFAPLTRPSLRNWDVASGKLKSTVGRFPLEVWALSFSPDGSTLALAGYSFRSKKGGVSIRDAASGKAIRNLSGHTKAVRAVAYSQDGTLLATGGDDMTIRIWEADTGRELRRFSDHAANPDPFRRMGVVGDLVFAPDGKTLASIANSRSGPGDTSIVHIWDVSTGKELRELGEEDSHRGQSGHRLAFSPDGGTLASGDETGIRLWDPATGEVRSRFSFRSITDIAYSPDAKALAIAGPQGIHYVDAKTGRDLLLPEAHHADVRAVAFAPDGRLLASGSRDGTIRIWTLPSGRQIERLPWRVPNGEWPAGHSIQGRAVTSVAFSPCGRYVVSTYGNPYSDGGWGFRVSDLIAKRTVAEFDSTDRKPHQGNTCFWTWEVLTTLRFVPGKGMLAAGSDRGKIRLWDLASAELCYEVCTGQESILAMGLSDGGQILETWGEQGRRFRWDTATGNVIERGDPLAGVRITVAELSPSARMLACGDKSGKLHVWNLEDGEKEAEIEAHTTGVKSIRFSPDGRRLLSKPDNFKKELREPRFRLWDLHTGCETLSIRAEPGWRSRGMRNGVPFEWPDPSRLADDVVFFPDGRWLASWGRDDGAVHLWEALTGQVIRSLEGHQGGILNLCLSPDGRILASASRDGTILLWDVSPSAMSGGGTSSLPASSSLEALWSDLETQDAPSATIAIGHLTRAGAEAVAFLGGRLKPVCDEVPKPTRRLVADLDHADYAVRERSSGELAKMGEHAGAALRKALEQSPSPEMHLRILHLLRALTPPYHDSPREPLRSARAIQALEWIGTEESRRLLEHLAAGSPWALQTREAKAALERLERQPKRK